MAQGYLRVPRKSPLRSTPTNAELLGEVTTQLRRIAHALQKIAYSLPVNSDLADWEIRERLGLPHTYGDTTCPPQHRPTKSSA